MRRSIKKWLLLSMASLMLVMTAISAGLVTNSARADDTPVYVENNVAVQGFEMIRGASVRIDENTGVSGMRFMVGISEEFKNYLSDTYQGASFTFGSLVDYKGRAVNELTVEKAKTDNFIKEANHHVSGVKIDAVKTEYIRAINYFDTEKEPTPEQMQEALDLSLSARYYVIVDSEDNLKDCVIYAKANDNIRTARAVINAYGIAKGTSNLKPEITKIGTELKDAKGDFEINVSDEDYEEITIDDLADGKYSVYYGAKNMGEVDAKDGVIVLPFGANTAIANHNVFTLRSGNNAMQNYKVNVVDKVIKDAEEFKTLLSTATNQHYVLGNDIGKVENYPCPYGVSFTGVLDGRAHSVEEISYKYYSDWWIYGSLFWTFNGTIKDISFDNMSLRYSSQNGITYDVADGNATLENVFINATTAVSAPMFGGAWADANITLNNVVVIMNCTNEGGSSAIMGSDRISTIKNATNVYVSGTLSDGSTPVPMSPSGDIPGCTYKKTAELLEMANNSEFEPEWLNTEVLANVKHVVDKTATQAYDVENWTTEGVTLTYAHNKPVFVAHDNLSDWDSTTIQKILANGTDLGYNAETGELDASKLTKGTATWDVYYSDNEVYKVTVNVVDAIIKNAIDFKEIVSNATTEHIILGNDIEAVSGYPCPYGRTFTGVLDGRGYSVSEITYSYYLDWWVYGYLFYIFNGTIKDISFDKITVQGATTLDNRQSGIAAQVGNGSALLENVFINVTTPTGAEVNAMFGTAWGDAYITLRNVVAIVNGTGTGTAYAIIGDNTSGRVTSVTNVYVSGSKGDGTPTPMSPSGDVTGCVRKSQSDLLSMANNSDSTLTLMAQNAIKRVVGN